MYENLRSIEPENLLADVAYAQLSEGILRNELAPGMSLSVPELARQFGISRSPVREAVQRLIYDGLADHRGRRGNVVSEISVTAFLALLEVREALEGLGAQLAAKRATEDELQQISECHQRMLQLDASAADSHKQFSEVDMRFHELIRTAARNDELSLMLYRTQARAHLSMHSLWRGRRHIAAAQDEHSAICGAILARDPSGANAAARDHISALRERVLALSALDETAATA